jgi:hypothetical protein
MDGKLRSRGRIWRVETQCAVVAQRSGGSCARSAGSEEDEEDMSIQRSAAFGAD